MVDPRLDYQSDQWYNLFAEELAQYILPDDQDEDINDTIDHYVRVWNETVKEESRLDPKKLREALTRRLVAK